MSFLTIKRICGNAKSEIQSGYTPFPAYFPLFLSFQYSWQKMFNKFFCRWLESNHKPLELEATALPTEPQPLPLIFFLNGPNRPLFCLFSSFSQHNDNIVQNLTIKSVDGVLGTQTRGGRMVGADESTGRISFSTIFFTECLAGTFTVMQSKGDSHLGNCRCLSSIHYH